MQVFRVLMAVCAVVGTSICAQQQPDRQGPWSVDSVKSGSKFFSTANISFAGRARWSATRAFEVSVEKNG